MSRSGYSDDYEGLELYRANVQRAIDGKRGQAMLRELLAALDAMPVKRLVAGEFDQEGEVCAFGALGRARGIDMSEWDREAQAENDEYLAHQISKAFNIAQCLAREVMWENDEGVVYWVDETPERRWQRMRNWVEGEIQWHWSEEGWGEQENDDG